MADQEHAGSGSFEEHVLADLHELARMVGEIHAELEEFRPVLAVFKPNGGTDVQRAGLVRALRKAARGG